MSGFSRPPRYDLAEDFPKARKRKCRKIAPLPLPLGNKAKKQKCDNEAPLGNIGCDLIKEILLRLPVKSLLRFKSVCKSWCSLIENSAFIRHRISFNHSSSSASSFIVLASINKSPNNTFLMLSPPDSKPKSKSKSKSKSDDYSTEDEEDEEDEEEEEEEEEEEVAEVEEMEEEVAEVVDLKDLKDLVDKEYDSYEESYSSEDESVEKEYVSYDSSEDSSSEDEEIKVEDDQLQLECSEIKVENLGFPTDCKCSSSIEIVGSCNGLVCLYDRIAHHVYLWNPSISEFKILPKPIHVVDNERLRNLVAFGFDVETKDYKVVILSAYLDSTREDQKPILLLGRVKCLCRVQVYNLSTDSWRLLEGLHSLPGDPFLYPTNEVLYLNGSCFFLARFFHTKQLPRIPENDRFIISFDFTKENITPIQLPDHHEDQMLYLRCWGDKMALFTLCPKPTPRGDSYHRLFSVYYDDFYCLPPPLRTSSGYPKYPKLYRPPQGTYDFKIQGSEDCNIWVLDEQFSSNNNRYSYVNMASWTKLHSFEIERQPGQWILPSCILNDGEFALLESNSRDGLVHEMKLYNLVTEEFENDFLSCCRFMSKAIAYKPSPVKLTASSHSHS